MEHDIWFNPRETERQIYVSANWNLDFLFLFSRGYRLNVNKSHYTAHSAQRFKILTITLKTITNNSFVLNVITILDQKILAIALTISMHTLYLHIVLVKVVVSSWRNALLVLLNINKDMY